MKRLTLFFCTAVFACLVLVGPATPKTEKPSQGAATSASNGAKEGQATEPVRSAADETAALEVRRKQLAEKEAALKAKEQELKNLASRLDSRIAELTATQKAVEGSLLAKKKESNERYKKILKIYRGLKPPEAAKLLNKLDDGMVIEMLNQMDQKTAVKLIPHLSQPNVLKWTRENLAAN